MKNLLLVLFMLVSTQAIGHEYESLFDKYGRMWNVNPKLLTGVAKAESSLKTNLGCNPRKKYKGLFQSSTGHCNTGNNYYKTKWNCNDLCNPEVNTAVSVPQIGTSIKRIQKACPTITVDNTVYLIYVGHNNGPGVLKYILSHKGCTKPSMDKWVQAFYSSKPNGSLNGVDAAYGLRKLNYGKRIVDAVKSAGAKTVNYPIEPVNKYDEGFKNGRKAALDEVRSMLNNLR